MDVNLYSVPESLKNLIISLYYIRLFQNLKSPIRGLRLYHQLLQPSSSNACYKHRCQHFCLLTPDGLVHAYHLHFICTSFALHSHFTSIFLWPEFDLFPGPNSTFVGARVRNRGGNKKKSQNCKFWYNVNILAE